MNREQSQMMKGVAILLMIFLHLFNNMVNVELCHNLIYIDGVPLAYVLSRATNPVAFFLILGGYGLYEVNLRGDKNRWGRLIKLMLHYWFILIVFISIGHFMYPDIYPGSVLAIIENVSTYETTYNAEMWFLLPYMILSSLAPVIFKIINKFRALTIVVITLLIHLTTSFLISRYGTSFFFHNYWAYNPLLVFHLLFNFCLGAIAARTRFFASIHTYIHTHTYIRRYVKIIPWIGILILVYINCVFAYNFFYAFGIITCLVFAPMPKVIKNILRGLGDNSMNMWMVHTWFCYYLFHNFIYSFKYPLLIFLILVIISYVSSLIINRAILPIERLLLTKKEIKEKPVL